MIELRDVSLALGGGRRGGEVRFHLDALEVGAGEAVALTGPSGCGKSTLLNLIAGLRVADGGRVCVAGVDLSTLSPERLDRHRGAHCGMVHQTFQLLAPFTATENVVIGLRFGARRRRGLEDHAVEALRRVGLGERLESRPHELSVGERQRVAIARALVGDAPILLADEPTGALDPTTGRAIHQLLRRVADEDGRTLVMVTHDLALAADLPRTVDCSGLISTPDARSDARPDDEHAGARP